MSKRKKPRKNFVFNSILIGAAVIITLLAIINGAYIREGYDLKIGEVSQKKYKATKRIENRLATENNKMIAAAAAAEMKPLLKKDVTVDERVIKNLNNFFIRTNDIRTSYKKEKARIEESIAAAEAQTAANPDEAMLSESIDGTDQPIDAVADKPAEESSATDSETLVIPIPSLPLALSESQTRLLMEIEDEEYESLIDNIGLVIAQVLDQGLQEVDTKSLTLLKDEFEKLGLDSLTQSLEYEIAASFLEPNYVIDEAATEKARQDIENDYVTVIVLKDQTIVDEGEVITAEAYNMLESLGLISKDFSESIPPLIGTVITVSVIFIIALIYIYVFHKNIVVQKKDALLLFIIYGISIFVTWLMIGLPYQLVPLLVFAMIVAMLLDVRLAVVLNTCITIIAMFILQGDGGFFVFFTISGLAISFLARFTTERSKVLTAGFFAILVNFMLSLGISLLLDKSYSTVVLYEAGYAAANGIITVIICVGSLPIWEAAFGVVTPIKLLDLINPNSPLLRRLAIEAPGTYHHSLIVANLAESAAYDIGANPNIASAGGYYHDIGKLKYPQYFIENQVGENPHDYMDAHSSAMVIFSHVTYGNELAETYKLPKIIKDMINQHHGNTLVKYFYHKAKNANPDEVVNCEDFRYQGTIPQTKEAAVIMLADTIEAAVRSMIPSSTSFSQVENLINTLIKDKLNDGQLTDSELTIKDIDVIAISFMRVFKAMYHERIAYPSDKDEENDKEIKDEKKEEEEKKDELEKEE